MIYPEDLEEKVRLYLEESMINASFKKYGGQFANIKNVKEDSKNLSVKNNCLIQFVTIDTNDIESDHADDTCHFNLLIAVKNLRRKSDQDLEGLQLCAKIRRYVYQTRFTFDNTNTCIAEPHSIEPIFSHTELTLFKITLKIHIHENLQYSN